MTTYFQLKREEKNGKLVVAETYIDKFSNERQYRVFVSDCNSAYIQTNNLFTATKRNWKNVFSDVLNTL